MEEDAACADFSDAPWDRGAFFVPSGAETEVKMETKRNIMKSGAVRKLATLGMLAALAYVVMLVLRVPILAAAPYLKYDAKDVILCIAGFLYGPVEGLILSLLVAALEMVTVSTTAFWGFLMNFLSSAAFVCTASLVYHYRRTLPGAIQGLACGMVVMTGSMLLWNWLVTPIYQGMPRQAVAEMLVPVFLPFNLMKSGLNTILTLLVYKPVTKALRLAKLVPPSKSEEPKEEEPVPETETKTETKTETETTTETETETETGPEPGTKAEETK